MRHKALFVGMLLFIIFVFSCHTQQDDFPVLKGPYLGQKPPSMTLEIFAPGIVSSEHQEHSSLSFSPDGKEMWWSRWHLPHDNDEYPQVIIFIKNENGQWSQPKVAPFSGKYRDGGSAFSQNGNKIFFYSRRPLEEGTEEMHDNDIWYVERTRDGWRQPRNLGSTDNSPYVDATPSLAANGNLYFTSDRIQCDDPTGNMDIFVSEFVDGDYTTPKGLGSAINTPYARDCFPFIAPDESYIIFSRDSRRFDKEGNVINGDRKLMISFKDEEGECVEALDMGPLFANTRFPSVSPDGKYLFFTKFTEGGHKDFYWVDAKVIEELKPAGQTTDKKHWAFSGMSKDQANEVQKAAAEYYNLPLNLKITLNDTTAIEFVLIPPGEFMMGYKKHGGHEIPNLFGIEAVHSYDYYAACTRGKGRP